MIPFVLAAATLGVATGLGYNSMSPRSQLFGRTFTGGSRRSRQIALTFDDGPNDPYTERLLEVLERLQVRATFFMIGSHIVRRPRVAQAVAQAGHSIGNHTFTHPLLIFSSPTQLRLQLEECERALRDAVGEHARLFRPPHGGRTPSVLRTVREMGFITVMWSVSGYDWKCGAGQIETNVMRRVRGGDVVLLHDGGHLSLGVDRSATIEAVERIIPRCRDQGYEFVTVPEMISNKQQATSN